jgi:hypothetical protein
MKEFITNDLVITPNFLEDQHLQLIIGGKVVMTICEPAGPGDQSQVCVWYGDGLDDNDDEAEPVRRFYTHHYLDVKRCWDEAVKHAYRMTILDHMQEG